MDPLEKLIGKGKVDILNQVTAYKKYSIFSDFVRNPNENKKYILTEFKKYFLALITKKIYRMESDFIKFIDNCNNFENETNKECFLQLCIRDMDPIEKTFIDALLDHIYEYNKNKKDNIVIIDNYEKINQQTN